MKQSYVGALIACLVLGPCIAGAAETADSAQAAIEKEIRILDNREAQAVLEHDVETLEQLWDVDFVVHNPEGRIVPAGRSVRDRPVLQTRRALFVREVESVAVRGDVAFSMGSETVVPYVDSATAAGEEIKRRYTNVWMRKDGSWKLVARHANRICSKD